MNRYTSRFFALLAFLSLGLPHRLSAGPGHDHGDGGHEIVSPISAAAPRIESVSADFELVAVPEQHLLTIYLGNPQTNEPIDNAEIEVSADGLAPLESTKSTAHGSKCQALKPCCSP